MKRNNSNISSENLKSESLLRLVSMSNGSHILGRVVLINHNVVRLAFPISLSIIYDSDGGIIGTSIAPYLMPFARLDPFAVVNFNIDQVVSFAEPAPELSEQYEKILQKVIENFLAMSTGMSESILKEMDMNKTEDEIDVDVWKPYSTMIH